jgi:hypothetical protein
MGCPSQSPVTVTVLGVRGSFSRGLVAPGEMLNGAVGLVLLIVTSVRLPDGATFWT